jgi:PAS domain S-box-containing protein
MQVLAANTGEVNMESIRKKVTLIILVSFSILLVCMVAYYSTKHFEGTVVTKTQQNLLTVARSQAMYIEGTIKYVEKSLETLAIEPEVQDYILSGTSEYGKVSPREERLYKNLQFLDLKIGSTYRLDKHGIVQSRIPFAQDRIGMDFSEKPGVKNVLETQKSCVSDVLTSIGGFKAISVCQPVFKGEQFIGIERCLILLDNIQNLMASVWKNQNGYINIIDSNSDLIAYPQLDLLGHKLVEARKKQYPSYDWSELENVVSRMAAGEEGVGSYNSVWFYEKNSPQVRYLTAFVPVHIGNKLWSLGVTISYGEIAEPIGAFSRGLFFGAGLLILSIIYAGFEFLRLKKRENYLEVKAQSIENLKGVNETLSSTNQQLQAEITDRKRTEQALNKSIEKFSRVIHGASDGFWDWNLVTNEVYLSPKYKELLGYEDYELESSYQVWESKIHPDDYSRVMQSFNDQTENFVPINIDYRLLTKSGEYRWYNARGQATWDDQGKPIRLSGSVRDITDMKIAQKNLEESEQFLSNVFSSVQDGVSVLDKDMNILKVNPSMERWYSHMMPFTGRKCYEVYHGRDAACDVCPSRQTLETGKPACEISPKTGLDKKIVGWFDLYSFPLFDKTTGELKGVIEYVRDISDRKKAEDELSEMHYLLKSTSAVIYRAKASGDYAVTFISENVTDQFGYNRDDFISDPTFWINHVHPDDREKITAELAGIGTGGKLACEYRFLHKDGTYRWVHNAANAICDDKNNCTEIVGHIIDITECKKAAKQESETLAAG